MASLPFSELPKKGEAVRWIPSREYETQKLGRPSDRESESALVKSRRGKVKEGKAFGLDEGVNARNTRASQEVT